MLNTKKKTSNKWTIISIILCTYFYIIKPYFKGDIIFLAERVSKINILIILLISIFSFFQKEKIYIMLEKVANNIYKFKIKKIYILLIGIILCAIFFIFLNKTSLLYEGDNAYVIYGIEQHLITKPYVINQLLLIINYEFWHLFGLSAIESVRIIDSIFGVLFIFLTFIISKILFKKNSHKILFFLVSISIGTIKIFFGDIEVYASPTTIFLVFIYFSILYISKKKSIVWPTLAFLTTFFLHTTAIVFFPLLIVLPIIKEDYKTKNKKNILIETVVILKLTIISILLILVFFIFIKTGYILNQKIYLATYLCPNCICKNYCFRNNNSLNEGDYSGIIIPWFKELNNNTIFQYKNFFSLKHFKEKLNSFLLLGPISILFIVTFILFIISKKSIAIKKDKILIFLTGCLVFGIIRLLMQNFAIIKTDWDIILMFGSIVPIWTGYYLLKYSKDNEPNIAIHVLLSTIFISLWIIIDFI